MIGESWDVFAKQVLAVQPFAQRVKVSNLLLFGENTEGTIYTIQTKDMSNTIQIKDITPNLLPLPMPMIRAEVRGYKAC